MTQDPVGKTSGQCLSSNSIIRDPTGELVQCIPVCPQVMALNESPVFLLLNPRVDHSRKNLPVTLFETGGWAALSPGSMW